MDVLRYAAFTGDPAGGNPAGVVLDARGATDEQMQAVATEVGYSETAFLFADRTIRYFSPLAEVAFCGHATIATAVAHADRYGVGELILSTRAGSVPVSTRMVDGRPQATLVSVEPRTIELGADTRTQLLAALRWEATDLDNALPPRIAFAGAWHPVIAAATRDRLARLAYDYPALASLMAAQGWTTVQLVFRESPSLFHSRNPFPPGGVVEDPATGAAAAALGGYLRDLGLVEAPTTIQIHQGDDLGRPGRLTVDIPTTGSIHVSGAAVAIPA